MPTGYWIQTICPAIRASTGNRGARSRAMRLLRQRLVRNCRLCDTQELAMPELKDREIKDLFGEIGRNAIFGKHSLDSAPLEIATLYRLGIKKKVVNPILQIST